MKKRGLPKSVPARVERCANPWNGVCRSTDVKLYIYYRGEQLPICRSCWTEIADKDFEWGGDYALT